MRQHQEKVPWAKMAFPHDHMDVGGTSPWMGEGRTMQEQLSSAMPGAIAE